MDRFVNILYEVALWILTLISLPKLLYNFFVYKKYRKSLSARLGFQRPQFDRSKAPFVVWIHAVSVGETKAVSTLVRQIKNAFPDSKCVISSVTETGHAEALRSLPFADAHLYLPFDFSPLTRAIVSRVSPDLVILCESDLWYNFLRHAKNQGATIALVNGKMSERSMRRFCMVPFFTKRLLGLFDRLCFQNELYMERYMTAGADSQKCTVTGNLKLDEEYPQLSPQEAMQWRERLGIMPGQLILTVGSTHDPEEKLLISTLKNLWHKYPHLKALLVPRHPERFHEVAALLESEQVPFVRYTEIPRRTGDERVILVDTMGLLRTCYQLCDIALVAGSYTPKVGGHNILEPCWYGKPVLFGPHMHTQVEFVELMKRYGAGWQVHEEGLKAALEALLDDAAERYAIGQNGLQLVADQKGATARTWAQIKPLLAKKS